MNTIVSVIVPVFNRVKTLKPCVDSILMQDYKSVEVILVDDGSSDGTSNICDKYKMLDSRVKVFHNSNHGVSYSRNFGITHSTGEYIIFVDSDDEISLDYVSSLMMNLKNNDLVVSSLVLKNINGSEIIDIRKFPVTGNITDDYYYLQKYMGGVWGKLYKRNIIKAYNIQFDNTLVFSEDRIFNIGYYKHISSYSIAGNCKYICNYNQGSEISHLSSQKTERAYISELKKIKLEKEFIEEQNVKYSESILGDAVASCLGCFAILEKEKINYKKFNKRAKQVFDIIGTMNSSKGTKRKILKLCYNYNFWLLLYIYYAGKVLKNSLQRN